MYYLCIELSLSHTNLLLNLNTSNRLIDVAAIDWSCLVDYYVCIFDACNFSSVYNLLKNFMFYLK